MFYSVMGLTATLETEKSSIFATPFFPEQLTFLDVIAIASFVLAIISIILSIYISHVSNATQDKLMDDVASRAIERYNTRQETPNTKPQQKRKPLSSDAKRNAKKILQHIFKESKKNSYNEPWVLGAYFPNKLNGIFSSDETILLMHEWRKKGYIKWSNGLSISTKVFILKEGKILEDINSR